MLYDDGDGGDHRHYNHHQDDAAPVFVCLCCSSCDNTHTHKWAKSAAKCADIFVHFQLAD